MKNEEFCEEKNADCCNMAIRPRRGGRRDKKTKGNNTRTGVNEHRRTRVKRKKRQYMPKRTSVQIQSETKNRRRQRRNGSVSGRSLYKCKASKCQKRRSGKEYAEEERKRNKLTKSNDGGARGGVRRGNKNSETGAKVRATSGTKRGRKRGRVKTKLQSDEPKN